MQRLRSKAGQSSLFRIRFQPKQRRFWELVINSRPGCPTKIGYGGARGGGKSKAGRDVMILLCLTFPAIDCLILRRTWKEVYSNHVVPMFREFPGLRQWWNESKKTLTFPNGSKLVFGYAEHKDDIFAFQGQEYAFILAEEATHFSEEELIFLETCNRWTKNPAIVPKLLYTTNPGNVGHDFIKRIFIDRDFSTDGTKRVWDPIQRVYREEKADNLVDFADSHRAEDYAFIQAYGWDNVEWAVPSFVRSQQIDPLTWKSWSSSTQEAFVAPFIQQYYSWTDEARFQFFTTVTDYGRKLNALSGQMRSAHLFGSWDAFVGQFFSEFSRRIHVVKPFHIPSWWERFTSFDWGFSSAACTLWHAVSPEGRVFTYREAYITKRDSVWLAKNNVRMSGTEKYRYNVGDPSCFNPGQAGPVISEVMGLNGWQMIKGDNDRVNGWARMREYLAWEIDNASGVLIRPPMWQMFSVDPEFPNIGCPNLIRTLPALVHDEHDPEDVDTNSEDHAPDSGRYGLMTRPKISVVPLEVMPEEYAEATRRAEHNEKRRHASD